jgi:hypothetical protein
MIEHYNRLKNNDMMMKRSWKCLMSEFAQERLNHSLEWRMSEAGEELKPVDQKLDLKLMKMDEEDDEHEEYESAWQGNE